MRTIVTVVCLSSLTLATGCAGRAEMPVGKWQGKGVACALEQKTEGDVHSVGWGKTGIYPTCLKIERVCETPERLRLEVCSCKGTLELEGRESTHLIAVIEEAWRSPDDMTAFYRLVEYGVSLDGTPPKLEQSASGPIVASLMARGKNRIFQIMYSEGFTDTYIFRGKTLVKTGIFHAEEGGNWVRWAERLKKKGWF
jgi:hypothetical protein